jgi:hypothetical protein
VRAKALPGGDLAGLRYADASWWRRGQMPTLLAPWVLGVSPYESTFRWTLQSQHADALDDAVGSWVWQAAAKDHAMLKKTWQGP